MLNSGQCFFSCVWIPRDSLAVFGLASLPSDNHCTTNKFLEQNNNNYYREIYTKVVGRKKYIISFDISSILNHALF